LKDFFGGLLLYNIDMSKADAKRKNIVKQAIANERLEGLKVSEESKRIADNYIVGKVTAKEAAKKIRARYGVL
jgi:hypothetical protein